MAMGAVMVVVALAMLGNYDIQLPEHDRQQTCRASSSTRPKGLEDTASARDALAEIRDGGHGESAREASRGGAGNQPPNRRS